MYLTLNNCDETEKCIKSCPTKSIRLINGVAFSCITCGICSKNCPNQAIFKNSYGGYVVDRAKCNGCGMCAYNCPTDNINLEDGVVYGICSRCGICAEEFPECRIDGFELERDNQITLIKSMQILNPPLDDVKSKIDAPKEVHIETKKKKDVFVPAQQIPDGDSGFSFEEALNPTEDLEEIMKAFDFYNEDKK